MSTTARDLVQSRADPAVTQRTLLELAAGLIAAGCRADVGC